MHQNHQKTQPHVCLICHKNIEKETDLHHFLVDLPLCQDCLQSFAYLDLHTTLEGYPLWILYYYNDFFKTLLFRYKGQYDYALKEAFLVNRLSLLKERYQDYIVVVAPSDQDSNQKRMFAPNDAIASSFSKHVFTGILKTQSYKQSAQPYEKRGEVAQVLTITHGEALTHQKVLLFDDVITSGATMRACLCLLKPFSPSAIEILVLASHSVDNFR